MIQLTLVPPGKMHQAIRANALCGMPCDERLRARRGNVHASTSCTMEITHDNSDTRRYRTRLHS